MNFVLVGYGAIAKKHLDVFRELGVSISASCNRSEEGNLRAREEGDIERTYTDPREMVEREKPDGILLCASFMSLYDLARNLIPFGLPMLLEKPPGVSLAQTQDLAQLARKYNTPVMLGLNRRFYSIYHEFLKEIGGKDAVTSVAVEWSEDPEKMIKMGYTPEEVDRFVFANSLHGIDLLSFFGGSIHDYTVWGRNMDKSGQRRRWQMGVDGWGGSDVRLHFYSNWDVPGRWRLLVDAPDRRLVSSPMESGVVLTRDQGKVEIQPEEYDKKFKTGFYDQARAFLNVVRDQVRVQWPAATLGDALDAMKMAGEMTAVCLVRNV